MIEFHAHLVETWSQAYTEDFLVYSILFEESDPEAGGQSWHFSRSLGEEDDGVCTVKEIQKITFYEGIKSFQLDKHQLTCEFTLARANEIGIDGLLITYALSDEEWMKL